MLYYIVENDGLPARAFTIKEGEDLARKDRLLQTTMLVTLVIIASKAVGFIREMVAAHYFGTQPEYDAYVAAYALFYIPVLLLNSCITSTLVPMYTEARARRGLERADRFASNAINILALIALGVTVLMLLLAGPLVRIVYSGYEPWKVDLTAELVRIMVLTLAFNITSISLASLLNAQEKYIAAQITGFPLSLAIISAAALFAGTHGVRALAWGVFAANILQTLVLVPFMRGWFHYRLIVDFRDRRFRHLMALAGPAVLSMAVSELNHMVDQWRASYGNPGDVSALSYGYKVITLLTGVVIVPLTTIMFSRMSRMVAEDNRRGILEIVRRSTVTIAMVMTPIIAICAVGNQDVIKALYLGGQFDLSSAAVTAGVFLFYVIGVLGFGLRDLLNRTFHAMQDTRTTMYVSAGIVVANVILNSIFHALMGVRGLALATTISGTGGMLVLFYLLRRRMRRLGMKRIVPDMAKIFLASGLTALVAWGVGSLMPVAENRMFAILRMLAMGGAGLGVYLLIALALGVTPLKEFIGRKGNANDGRRTADHHGLPRGGRTGGRVAAPADADRVLRTGKTEKKPERVHAGRHRPPRAAGSSAAIRPARAGQDDAGRHHRRGDGAQHTHHQRPRH